MPDEPVNKDPASAPAGAPDGAQPAAGTAGVSPDSAAQGAPEVAATAAPTETTAGAPVASVAGPAPAGEPDMLRERLVKWFEKVAADWASKQGKKGFAQVGASAVAGSQQPAISEPFAVKAVARLNGGAAPLMIVAGEQAAVSMAKMISGAEGTQALDDAGMAAFGERARQTWVSIEEAIKADGAQGFAIEPAAPGRLDRLPDEFAGGATTVPVVVSFDDNTSIPFSLVYSAGFKDILPWFKAAPAGPPAARLARLLKISVPLTVEIASRSISIREVLALRPGTVLEFEKNSEEFIDLCVGEAMIGRGEAVKVGESFGMRVLEIGSVRDRIQTLRK